jgi:hypothetical protein
MGASISIYDTNILLQKYLPDFTFERTLSSKPMEHSFMCQTQDEGHVVCKFFLEDLSIDDPEVLINMHV